MEEYTRTCVRFGDLVGRHLLIDSIGPAQFSEYKADRAKTCNLVAVGNEISRVRSMFKWLFESQVLSEPMRFDPDFRKPSKKSMRRHRRLKGSQLYEPEELRLILHEAPLHPHAMILLDVNAGFGNADLATLPLTAVDLDSDWLD